MDERATRFVGALRTFDRGITIMYSLDHDHGPQTNSEQRHEKWSDSR